MARAIVIVLAAVAVVGAAALLFGHRAHAPKVEKTTLSPQDALPSNVTSVTYTSEKGFVPGFFTVKQGASVTFTGPQPFETVADTRAGKAYDPLSAPQPATSFTVKFDTPGTWSYHEKSDASKLGTVLVTTQ